MELRHLRSFIAVAEELSFRRAAERLHISQPPLSKQIQALEAELGVTLLDRDRRRVALTAAGEAFLREARATLQTLDEGVQRARRAARGEVGRLAVGFVGSAMYGPVPDVLGAFRSHFPDVDLQLRELSTAQQLDALATGRIDVGFVRPPSAHPDVQVDVLLRESVVVALPPAHPLAARDRLSLGDLQDASFVLLGPREAPGLHRSLTAALARRGFEPHVVQEVVEMQTLIGLVVAGLGISLVPESVAALERRGVTYRPLTPPVPTVELALAWRETAGGPVLDAFLDVARAVLKEQRPRDGI